MTSFTRIAPHYEDLMDGVPYQMWVSYLELLWANVEAKPKKVLEVCCGTGKLCRLLTAKRYQLTGVDLSQEMIREAKRISSKEGLHIRFEAQDAAKMELNDRFDAAFSFFDSFNYITDPDKCATAIAKTAEHLKNNGSFAFDLNTEYAFEQKMFDQQSMKADDKVRYKWKSEYEPKTRICTISMSFWTERESFMEIHTQRAHSNEEIEEWMRAAGFQWVRLYDAYTLDPPRGRSDRIHVVGKT